MEQEDSQALMRKRGAVIERVFAQIKGHWNFHRWQFKGLTNVRAQWDLLCTTWNLTRIFARWQIDPSLLTRAATLG